MSSHVAEQKYPFLIITFLALSLALLGVLSFNVTIGLWILAGFCLFVFFCFFIDIGLYITILALPVIHWDFYLGNLIIPLSDLLGLFLLAAFSLRYFGLRFFSSANIKKLQLPFIVPFGLFLVVAYFSSTLAHDPLEALWYTTRWLLFFYLAFVVVPVNILTDEKKIRKAIISLIISAVAIAIIGTISLFFQDWQHTFVRIQPVAIFNIYPLGANQNLIAEFLVIAVFFTLALKSLVTTRQVTRVLNLIALFLALTAILTFSRAAWLVLLLQTLVYLWYQSRTFRKEYLIALGVGLIILIPLSFYMFALQSEYQIGISSTENRLLLTDIAVKAFVRKPWLGEGSGAFYNLVADNIRFRAQYGDPLDSHGLWQKILAEQGLFGITTFAFFLFALLTSWGTEIKRLAKIGQERFLLLLAVAAGGGIVFQFFNTSYYKGKVWLPVGITIATWYLSKKKLYGATKKS